MSLCQEVKLLLMLADLWYFSNVLCYRYIHILCSLMSDDCRYLLETFDYDKNLHGGNW